MSTFKLWTRSFHPLSNFGLGGLLYEGDNRGFSDDPAATSRVWQVTEFTLEPPSVSRKKEGSYRSRNWLTGTTEDYSDPYKQPTSTADVSGTPFHTEGIQSVKVHIAYKGQNFAIPLLPKEWVKEIVPYLRGFHDCALSFNRDIKKLTLHSNVYGSGFPNCEAFIIDPAGTSLFLGTHIRFGSASGQLWGSPRNAMTHAQLVLDLSGTENFAQAIRVESALDYHNGLSGISHFEGNFSGGTSISTWNSFHRNRNPSDGLSWMRDNTPGARGVFPTVEKEMPQ